MPRYSQTKRDDQMNLVRRRLIDAAVEEIDRNGYTGANINNISLAAGFAKGTIYNYFPSKQALMLAIITEMGASHLEYIAGQVRQESNPEQRLVRFFEAGFAFVEHHPIRARVLISTLYGANAELKGAMAQTYMPMFLLVSEEILLPGIEQGFFRPMNVMGMASLLMTLYLGTGSTVDEQGKVRTALPEVTDFALRALRSDPTPGTLTFSERIP